MKLVQLVQLAHEQPVQAGMVLPELAQLPAQVRWPPLLLGDEACQARKSGVHASPSLPAKLT